MIARTPGIAPSVVVRLPYVSNRTATASATALLYGTDQYVTLNSLYGTVGHQPYGFDQFAAMYRQYKVLSVRTTFEVFTTTGVYVTFSARIYPPGSTAVFSGADMNAVAERPGTQSIFSVGSPGAGGAAKNKLTFNLPLHEVLGITKEMYDADSSLYAAAVGADPTRNAQIQFAIANLAGTSSTAQVLIRQDFEVLFWQRSTLTQS
jgi:hypothetical protein